MITSYRLKPLLLLLCSMLLLAACSAPMPTEEVGESQEAVCTGAPVATGSVGSSVPVRGNYFTMAPNPGVPHSALVATANGSGSVSWGSTSDLVFRTTGCTDVPCVAWPSGSITTLKLQNAPLSSPPYVGFYVNGVKAAELTGATNVSSLQNTLPFSGGLYRIRQDTGSNSRFYFEGYDAGVWTSRTGRFVNACGSIP